MPGCTYAATPPACDSDTSPTPSSSNSCRGASRPRCPLACSGSCLCTDSMSDLGPDPAAAAPEANGGAAGPPVPAVLTSAQQSLDQQLVEHVQAQFAGLTAGPSSASSNGTSTSTAVSSSAPA